MTEKIDSTVGYFLGSQFPILRSHRLEAAAMDVAASSTERDQFFRDLRTGWLGRFDIP